MRLSKYLWVLSGPGVGVAKSTPPAELSLPFSGPQFVDLLPFTVLDGFITGMILKMIALTRETWLHSPTAIPLVLLVHDTEWFYIKDVTFHPLNMEL